MPTDVGQSVSDYDLPPSLDLDGDCVVILYEHADDMPSNPKIRDGSEALGFMAVSDVKNRLLYLWMNMETPPEQCHLIHFVGSQLGLLHQAAHRELMADKTTTTIDHMRIFGAVAKQSVDVLCFLRQQYEKRLQVPDK